MIQIPEEAEINILGFLFGSFTPWIHLYVVDIPIDADTTLTSLEFSEASYPGYSPQIATGWESPEIVEGRAQVVATEITFTRGAGPPQQDVYGYFATDGVEGVLLWVERGADAPYPMRVSTDRVNLTPRFSLRGEARRVQPGL